MLQSRIADNRRNEASGRRLCCGRNGNCDPEEYYGTCNSFGHKKAYCPKPRKAVPLQPGTVAEYSQSVQFNCNCKACNFQICFCHVNALVLLNLCHVNALVLMNLCLLCHLFRTYTLSVHLVLTPLYMDGLQ